MTAGSTRQRSRNLSEAKLPAQGVLISRGMIALLFLVASAVAGVLFLSRGHSLRRFVRRKFHPGAPIIYRVQETSNFPARDACEVFPSEHGETYSYITQKFWRVDDVIEDEWIVARTPLREQHFLRRDDPNLRKATILERLRYAARFPLPA